MHIMTEFFKLLDDKGVQYAHFKSNLNLERSFLALGDFDIIVDSTKNNLTHQILLSLNAKQVNTVFFKHYPGVDNWLLLDNDTGLIHHLHLHYQIISGKKFVKDYEIPWKDVIISTRVYDKKWGIYISDPNIEYLLLTFRSVIKSNITDFLKSSFGFYKLHPSLLNEKNDLLTKIDKEKLQLYISSLFMTDFSGIFLTILLKKTINGKDFLKLSRIVRQELYLYRRMSKVKSIYYNLIYSIIVLIKKFNKNRKFAQTILLKKTSLTKGGIFAFVGVDGAGKSSTAYEINKWLTKHFESRRAYMGMGDAHTSIFYKVLKKIRKKLPTNKSLKNKSINSIDYKPSKPINFFKTPLNFLRKVILILFILSIEKNNRKELILMNKYRINGGISILDRYPQIELPNVNDGPKIEVYKGIIKFKKFLNYSIKKEKKLLEIVKIIKPDIIFRINISAEESMNRKSDQYDISIVNRKIKDLKNLNFQGSRIIEIDGTLQRDKEISLIKSIIWNYL